MLIIHQPVVSVHGDKARLSAVIEEGELKKTLWYEVEARYADSLNTRSDAFVVALLYWAMLYHQDITCDAPLTTQLHFQLQEVLMPLLASKSTHFKAVSIHAPLTSEPMKTQGAVGTGCSCGIDSFNVIATHLNSPWPQFKLTHIATFSVGHFYERIDNEETMNIVKASEERAARVAKELNLDIVHVRSNYNDEFPQVITYVTSFADMACVHALAGLFGTYFYASSGSGELEFDNRESKDSSGYDIVSLPNFSTPSLQLYVDGAVEKRWQKMERVTKFPLAKKMLNVCCQELRNCGHSDGVTNRNCGICDKCLRTLLDLEVIGCLDDFGAVFDLDAYRNGNGRRLALRTMLKKRLMNSTFVEVSWKAMKQEIGLADYWAERKTIFRAIRKKIRAFFGIKHAPIFKDTRKGTGK